MTSNQFDVRIDQSIKSEDQLFGRVSYTDRPYLIPGPFQGVADGGSFGAGDFTSTSFSSVLGETHPFTPTLINEFRIGFSRVHTTQLQPLADTMGIPAQYGIQGIPQLPTNGGLPRYDISGLTSLGAVAFLPGKRVSDTAQIAENLTKVYGSHTFKGGVEYQYLRHPWFAPAYPRGEFGFNASYTEVPNASSGTTGLAQLLLSPTVTTVPGGYDNVGGAATATASNFAGPDDVRHYYGTYFNDDWRLTRRITLNLGIRWDYFGLIREKYGAEAKLVPKPPGAGAVYLLTSQRKNTPLSQSFLTTLAKDGIDLNYSSVPGLTATPTLDFSPRVGLAYEVTHKLVARMGYGIYYGGIESIGGAPDLGENYPFLYNFSFFASDPAHPMFYPDGSIGTLENGLAGVTLSPTAVNGQGLSLQGWQDGYKTPYVQEYNLSLQYAITPQDSIQIGYIGNTSRHLLSSPGLNALTAILPPGVDVHAHVPYPDFGVGATYVTSQANAYYNSLQLTYERKFSAGLMALVNYTYSKCRSDYDNLLGIGNVAGYRAGNVPGFGIQGDYGLCGYDVTNIIHLSGGYQLPFGKGQRFGKSASGALNQIIGGWSTNWILTLQGGYPFTVGCPISTTSGFGCNALTVPGQGLYAGPHDVNQWLNPNAFATPPVATAIGQTDFAPLGGTRSQAFGPGFHRLDFSIFKNIKTTETTRLQFRAEFFNLTNTPQFANPSFLDFTNTSTFGRITSLRDGPDDPRQIQFALKFYW
jgi:hypothetical protein